MSPFAVTYIRSSSRAFALLLLSSVVSCLSIPVAGYGPAGNRTGDEKGSGLPLGFSVEKMDRTADPRSDYRRYAAGGWLSTAQIPSDGLFVAGYQPLIKKVEMQIQGLLAEAASAKATAKGDPAQLVGDFYVSGMDEKRLTELGISPVKAEMDRIAKIDDSKSLAAALARVQQTSGNVVIFGLIVGTDTKDRRRSMVYATDGSLTLGREFYLDPNSAKIREGYLRLVTDYQVLSGTSADKAGPMAAKILDMEIRIARKKLNAVEFRDPAKRFVPMRFSELRSLLSGFDLDTFMKSLGVPPQEQVIVMEVEALRERARMLAEYPLADTREFLRWELIRHASTYLTPAFRDADNAFYRVLYGKDDVQPRADAVADTTSRLLGHPLSRLYVAKYFSPETKKAAEDLIGQLKAEFRRRLENNAWLSAQTRRQALAKLDKLVISVGYPSKWIDYAGVDIRRDDFYGNAQRLNDFSLRRNLNRLGRPVENDAFSQPGSTLPIVINAAYDLGENKIEIPAAFLQPPFYDVKADAAVNYGTLGVVIGHEITHGFDSQGRLFDADGNVRDWWTPEDAAKFGDETEKLVRQGDSYEVLPGLRLNGRLSFGENLADVGGLMLGFSVLQGHLSRNPEQRRTIDGLTPEQRFFLAWAQLFVDKSNEGYLRVNAASDPHPPGIYRPAARAQHSAAFFEAFGIRPGDPLWPDETARVSLA